MLGKWSIILLPFSFLYHLITRYRNKLFDTGKKTSQSFPLPLINIGNLAVGGTGKTPHTSYLIELLKDTYNIATLSRGYGRKTKGFLKGTPQTSALELGDEPKMLQTKYSDTIEVFVCEKRVEGIQNILKEKTTPDVILLDDAFQHRYVTPSLNIMISTYQNPFFTDYVVPRGYLRESRTGAKRADVIIYSKCPSTLDASEKKQYIEKTKKYTHQNVEIFFSTIAYGKPFHLKTLEKWTNFPTNEKILLVSGIGEPKPLEDFIAEKNILVKHINNPDHFRYQLEDIEEYQSQALSLKAKYIIITEKDAVKIQPLVKGELKIPILVLPITIEVLGASQQFNSIIEKHIARFQNKSQR